MRTLTTLLAIATLTTGCAGTLARSPGAPEVPSEEALKQDRLDRARAFEHMIVGNAAVSSGNCSAAMSEYAAAQRLWIFAVDTDTTAAYMSRCGFATR